MDSSPVIERMTAATLGSAARLLRAQLQSHGIALDEATELRALGGLLDDERRGFALLAHGESEAVGLAVCAFTWTVEHGGQVAWLDELYVVPELRGRGLGLALLRRAISECERAGCLALELEVDRDHARAARLYVREGFEPLPRARYVRALAAESTSLATR